MCLQRQTTRAGMVARLIAVALPVGVMPAALSAQVVESNVLQPGARVRLAANCVGPSFPAGRQPSPGRPDWLEGCTQYDGTLTRLSTDSVAVVADGEEVAIARSDIGRMQVRMGTRGNWVIGAVIGAGVGLGVGLATALPQNCGESWEWGYELCRTTRLGTPVAAGVIGAAAGALLGGLVRSDRWETVSIQVTAAVPRPEATLRLGLAIAF